MLEYFRRAFWWRFPVPGLGPVPANVLALVGFGILGFGEPAFWLLGAGLELGYLFLFATHPRFQKLIQAERRPRERTLAEGDAGTSRAALLAKLDPAARRRVEAIEAKCRRVLELAADSQADGLTLEHSGEALSRLSWTFLKLLVGRRHLESSRASAGAAALERQIGDLEASLASPETSTALRRSQEATLALLEKRRQNLARYDQTLSEIDSDLERIEAQIDLAGESAALSGRQDDVTAHIELASQDLSDGLDFGEASGLVAALDRAYAAPPVPPPPLPQR